MFLRITLIVLLSFSLANAEPEPDKWEGYVEFTGRPGTTRSFSSSEGAIELTVKS